MAIPLHEYKILEAHVRGIPRPELALTTTPLSESQTHLLTRLIEQREAGQPLQYITGEQDFFGRPFRVDKSVLIPRPETEALVEKALEEVRLPRTFLNQQETHWTALDFGTGSGCIAITLAQEEPRFSTIVAVDSSEAALAIATENVERHGVSNRVKPILVSHKLRLSDYHNQPAFDVILSNPPYLLEHDTIAADVRGYEPAEALFAPETDPLFYYRFLADLLRLKKTLRGFGAFEVEETRARETAAIFEQKGFTPSIYRDLAGRDRIVIVR